MLWLDDGRTQEEVAQLLGTTDRVVRQWVKRYRQGGIDKLCELGYRGRQCELTAEQIEQLLKEIDAGRFRAAKQVRRWLEDTFSKQYSLSGVKDLLRRLGASFHKTSALMFKADRKKQEDFLKKIPAAEAPAG